MHTFTPCGVCSRAIHLELDGERVAHVDFVGGCDGNLKAISKLVEGMTVDEVAAALEGNTCGRRATSCADSSCAACARRARRNWPARRASKRARAPLMRPCRPTG